MSVNCFLVKSAKGWSERKNTSSIGAVGRNEARLDLGALQVQVEIDRVADGQLRDFAKVKEQLTHIIEYRDDVAKPYLNYREGDSVTTYDSRGDVTTERILGFTGSVDNATGQLLIAPVVADILLPAETAVLNAAKKMIPGTINGQSKAAQPVVPRHKPQQLIMTPIK